MSTSRWIASCVFIAGVSVAAGCGGDLHKDNGHYWNCLGEALLPGYSGNSCTSSGDCDTIDLPDAVIHAGNVGQVCADPPPSNSLQAITDACADTCGENYRIWGVFVSSSPPFVSFTQNADCQIQQIEDTGIGCTDPIQNAGHGPAQSRAEIGAGSTGSVTVNSVGSASTTPSGFMRYSVGQCNGTCAFQVVELALTSGTFSLGGNDVTNLRIDNEGNAGGTIDQAGHFTIPTSGLQITANFDYQGDHGSSTLLSSDPVTGTIDPVTGAVSLGGAFTNSDGQVTLDLEGDVTSRPPHAVITAPATAECNLHHFGSATLDGSASTGGTSPIAAYRWTVEPNTLLGLTATTTAVLPLGPSGVLLTVTDQAGAADSVSATVTVVDTQPPSVTPTGNGQILVCNPVAQDVAIPLPTMNDVCTPDQLTLRGTVISRNGQTLAPPITLVNGHATLSPGRYVVQWTATDHAGNARSVSQTINVLATPTLYGRDTVAVDDRALVKLPASGFGTIENSGAAGSTMGADSNVGNLLSVGPVFLRSRARVNGFVQTQGAITRQDGTVVSDGAFPSTPVVLTAFPTVNAPPGSFGTTTVSLEPGAPPRTLAPGGYGAITAKTNTTIRLSAGSYFVTSLDLEPGASLVVTSGPVQFFVRDSLLFKGRDTATSGFPNFTLNYIGTAATVLESTFSGTFIAPSASVVLSSTAASYEGTVFAKSIELRPGVTIIHHPLTCP